MNSSPISAPTEDEVGRVRELSKAGRYDEALAAAEALAVAEPDNRAVLYLLAANQRCLNRISDAVATLLRLEQQHPRFSLLHQERGHCYVTLGDLPRAISAFQRAVALNPALVASWTMLERLYRTTGDIESAGLAAQHLSILNRLPHEVVRAGSLFSDGELSAAERILRTYVTEAGDDAEALRLLARIERQRNRFDTAESLLVAALTVAPDSRPARLDHARILIDRQKYPQAREAIDRELSREPANREYLLLSAAARMGLGQPAGAIAIYRQLLTASPTAADLHVALGHALKSVGQQQAAINAYQAAAIIRPGFGDAYWSLANLKTYRFCADEVDHMAAAEASPATDLVDRCHLCFALGKAYEDRQEFEQSWRFYERGNRLMRAESQYRPDIVEGITRRQIHVCTAEFFSARARVGAPDADPIFVVGLPRSGSTLIEQILASHSQVEGTHELSDIPRIVLEMQHSRSTGDDSRYPDVLAELTPDDFRRLGQRYLTDARAYRTNKRFFIDKMPNNFRHVGLIHLILPNATIIDVRREPMACCFSNLKQLFASGQEFAYGIEDISRYYRTYLDLMRHWDAVLPGRVLRVWYEDVVENLERHAGRILEFCGLDFEAACVEYYKTERTVSTASSEQVRRPIFRESLFQWRHYEPWLGPLRDGLGDALTAYRK